MYLQISSADSIQHSSDTDGYLSTQPQQCVHTSTQTHELGVLQCGLTHVASSDPIQWDSTTPKSGRKVAFEDLASERRKSILNMNVASIEINKKQHMPIAEILESVLQHHRPIYSRLEEGSVFWHED